MAKSFHTIIDEGNFQVSHQGEEVTLVLPPQLAGMQGLTESEQDLATYCEKEGILLALLQRGIQAAIIDARAIARPADQAGDKRGEKIPVSIVSDKEGAQKRLDEWEMKPIKRPGTGGDPSTQARKMVEKLRQSGMAPEDIIKALGL